MTDRTEHDRLLALAHAIHEEARNWTTRKGYVVGSVMRGCANRILAALGELTIPYEGPAEPLDWRAIWDDEPEDAGDDEEVS